MIRHFRWVSGVSGFQAGRNGKNISEQKESMCEEEKLQAVLGKAVQASGKNMEMQTPVFEPCSPFDS